MGNKQIKKENQINEERQELLDFLLKNEETSKDTYIFILENQRVTEKIGFFKIEVIDFNKTPIFKFKIQLDLEQPNNQKTFEQIKIGESKVNVGFAQLPGKSFFEKIKEGIFSAVEDGRIPFFPGS